MSLSQIEIQLVGVITAAACVLPGVYLVLRRQAMMSDAISHTVLLGIVIGFFLTGDLASPWLILGAAAVGVLTVLLTNALESTRLVREDAATGLVFPALFSLAVILISSFAGEVHLDTDAVLTGEIAFAPFERFTPFGADLGPLGLWLMGGILLINLGFIVLFYKELKLSTFDPALAASLGFAPVALHLALMSLTSITVVGAFDIVGSILVVALMITPPAAAYLLTEQLGRMIGLSILIGALSAISGYWLAFWLDASIAGAMATAAGLIFLVCLVFAPQRGLLANWLRRREQRWSFARAMLAIHLLNHAGSPEEAEENQADSIQEHLEWQPAFTRQVIKQSLAGGLVERQGALLRLTPAGRSLAEHMLQATR